MRGQSVIIIGGGLGGLFCGAILAREGYRVTIFEQHDKIGGGLHEFQREGVSFETGMHVTGGFQPGGVLNRLCTYLGIMGQLDILPADEECFELLHVASDGKRYCLPRGAGRYVEALAREFPGERENIRRYMEALFATCDGVKLYNLELPSPADHADDSPPSVGEFIDSFTGDERLRHVLAFHNPLYAGDRYRTPAYIHALVSKLYIEGASRLAGGSRQLADALAGVITRAGGEVHAGRGVTRVEIEGKAVDHVVTADGERHRAAWYISSIYPSSLFDLLDRSRLQRSYWQRVDSIPVTYSAFTLFIIFKPRTFPYINYTCYYTDDYAATWEQATYTDDSWPRGLMFLTPPAREQGPFAEKMIVTCIMNFETVKQWEQTTTGHRGEAYEAFKRRCEQRVLEKLETARPGTRACIKSVYSATPLTIRDYYRQKEGALYGVKRDCRHVALSRVFTRTKLSNLLLTGQNINLHGILGVPLTAIATCAELLGMEYLLERIKSTKHV